ncbi:MAG: universal stress protein [Nocardioides sp.]
MSIIAAFTPDQHGRAAVTHAAAEARGTRERLVVLNLTSGQSLVDRGFADESDIASLTETLRSDGVDVDVRHDVVPDVADAILQAAETERARLIVVGVRRRTPVGKLIMGSVSQRVILEADCPVLAVKS